MEMDPRLKNLSYSSDVLLHLCPRKYQLYKLNGKEITLDGDVVSKQSVTFAFGTVVGEGCQEILRSGDIDKAIWKMFLSWDTDLSDYNEKQNKSFSLAVFAVQKFAAMRKAGMLEGYDLVYYEGKPATELSFCINFPDGFRYRGYVDAVLKHRISGRVLVLELKTSSWNEVNESTFKNSAQALGYSVVLDVLFPLVNSYEVLYLVYLTKQMEFGEPLSFPKTYLQRALWIQEVLLDIEMIKMYEQHGIYPMHGESCRAWFRDCEYFNLCTLSTKNITKPLPSEQEIQEAKEAGTYKEEEVYQINLSLNDLIQAQINKSIGATVHATN